MNALVVLLVLAVAVDAAITRRALPSGIMYIAGDTYMLGESQFPLDMDMFGGANFFYYYSYPGLLIDAADQIYVTMSFSKHMGATPPFFMPISISLELSTVDIAPACLAPQTPTCNDVLSFELTNDAHIRNGTLYEFTLALSSRSNLQAAPVLIFRTVSVMMAAVQPLWAELIVVKAGTLTESHASATVNITSADQITMLTAESGVVSPWDLMPHLTPEPNSATMFNLSTLPPLGLFNESVISIIIPHIVPDVVPYQRVALRLSILAPTDNPNCTFPLTMNTCRCTALAYVDLFTSFFRITAVFNCLLEQAMDTGIVLALTRLTSHDNAHPIFASGFPNLQPTNVSLISFLVNTTTFGTVETTSTTSSTSTLATSTTTAASTTTSIATTSSSQQTATTTTTTTTAASSSSSGLSTSTLSATTTTTTTDDQTTVEVGPPPVFFNASNYDVEALGGRSVRMGFYIGIGVAALAVATATGIICSLARGKGARVKNLP